MSLRKQLDLSVCDARQLPLMPAPVCSPELVPRPQQSSCDQRVKIFLEIAFISNQPPELTGFPSLLDRIERCVVKETVDVPVWITKPVNRPGIPMEEFCIRQLARSTILMQSSLADLALHLGFHTAHRFIHSRSRNILNHLIACDR